MNENNSPSELGLTGRFSNLRGAGAWLVAALLASLALLAAYQIPYTYSVDLGNSADWFFISGFHGSEQDQAFDFRWSTASSSLVFPAIVQNQTYQLGLSLASGSRPPTAPPPQVTLYVNGAMVKTVVARPEFRTYSVKIGPRLFVPGPDLQVRLDVPTFNPSQDIAGSTDDRNLGVIVDRVDLVPAGLPEGFIALPPLTQWLGWVLVSWIWPAMLLRTGWARTERARRVALLSGPVLTGIGLAFARAWAAAGVWYVCAALVLGWVLARPLAGWFAEFRMSRRIPFGFLHTLGIANTRVRIAVEVGIVLLLTANYLVTIVLPLRSQVLGDFSVYYAGAGVWLQGGNMYDQSQLQGFNLTHSLLDGQIGPFTSPPSALLLFAPFALLPFAMAKAAWLGSELLLLVGSGIFLWLAVRASVPQPPSAVWLALMFTASQSLEHSFDFGQVNTLYSFLFALGLWAWTRRRGAITGAAMAVGAAVKVFSGIFLPYFILKRAWRALAASVAAGAVTAIVTSALTGAQAWWVYLFNVLPVASEHRVSSFDQSLLVFLRRTNFLLGILPDNDQLDKSPSLEMRLVALFITIALLALTAWWFGRVARRDELFDQIEFAAVIVVMMLVLPRMWEHYLMWLILPFYLILAFLANRRLTVSGQAGLLIIAGLSWFLSQDSPALFTRPGWPTALISIGLYGTFLIYVCLLFVSSQLAGQLATASSKPARENSREAKPLKVGP